MSTSILLSIHPQFVTKILSGEKRYEYRTIVPSKSISDIFIYATSPYKKCIAVAKVEEILKGSPSKIWYYSRFSSGISRSQFREYFNGHRVAYAYKLGRVYPVIQNIDKIIAPQSFRYITDNQHNLFSIGHDTCYQDNTIFVAGIHGIGKSTFLTNYISPLGFKCFSSSTILRMMNGEVQYNKTIKNIESNQQLLINGIKKYKEQYNQLAIDGHFVLLNENNEFTNIDEKVFKAISPTVIILLTTTSPSIVKKHLIKRDLYNSWSLSFISDFLSREKQVARQIAKMLNIPLIIFDIKTNYKYIINTLKHLIMYHY